MRKSLIAMMFYVVLFGALTIISLYNYSHTKALLDIGLPVKETNIIVLLLSFAGLIKSVWHIHRMTL